MKIPPRETDGFINSRYKAFAATLVYGNDYGRVSDRVQQIIKNAQQENFNPDFNLIKIDYKDLTADPSILENEINAISFNNHPQIIHIAHASSTIKKDLVELLETNSDAVIIVSTEELTPASSLRKNFESSKKLACLACYHSDQINIKNLISSKLKEEKYIFSSQIVDYLSSKLGNDHLIALNEIEKVILYFADTKQINYDDLVDFYTDTNRELSSENFINYFVNGKIPQAINELHQLIEVDKNQIAIVRQMISFFQKIKLIKAHMMNGKNEQEAMSKIRPPIFYKSAPFYRLALKKLTMQKLDYFIEALLKLEIQCKSTYIDQTIFLEKFVTDNARLVSNFN